MKICRRRRGLLGGVQEILGLPFEIFLQKGVDSEKFCGMLSSHPDTRCRGRKKSLDLSCSF